MLRAVGMGDDDWEKPQIGIASSWNEITPCNLSLDRLAQGSKEGVHAGGGYPLQFGTVDGARGDALLARESRGHRRQRRDRRHGGAPRRHGAAGRLRQVASRHAHGRRAPRARERLPLRGLHRPRVGQARRRHGAHDHDHRLVRGRRRVQGRPDERSRPQEDRVRLRTWRGRLRRNVHRQHHGVHRGGARHEPPRILHAAERRPPSRHVRAPLRRGRRGDAPQGDHDEGHPDAEGIRERRHGRDGVGRIHERRAAPARDRARSRRRAHPRGLPGHRRALAPPRRRQAVRPVRRAGLRSRGRHACRDEGAPRRGPAARPTSTPSPSTAPSCATWTTRSTPPGG